MFTRRIPLGKSFTDPAFMSSLLGVSFASFLLLLGVAAVLVASMDYFCFAPSRDSVFPTTSSAPPESSPSATTTTTSHTGFQSADHWARFRDALRLPLYTLFVPTVPSTASSVAGSAAACRVIAAKVKEFPEGSSPCDTAEGIWFLFLHLTAAAMFAWVLAWQVQRRRFVLDFVVSVYAAYSFLGWIVTGVCPFAHGWWWLSVLVGMAVSFAGAAHWSSKMEMQQIEVGGGLGNGGGNSV